ncbi:sigma-70 family RNA polymerase sigma factor [Nocardioides sp. CPCC 205120]|uniref:sigma-70 family RNA polymerase sigma factor n=1 Tax=Nocardioides sp. CPCC 205120 TaxID=3406462 RepID=UPI003B5062D0
MTSTHQRPLHAVPTTPGAPGTGGVDDDTELLERARAGDAAAVATLFERYHPLAVAMAARRAGPGLADDLAATAFERILRLLREGRGPRTAFRPYLAAAVNSAWVDHVRRDARLVLVPDDEDLDPLLDPVPDGADERFELATVGTAFAGLPPRWQHVLWHTAVEGMSHEDVGELLGISANAVGVLAHRAREGLRTAYLDAHLGATTDAACTGVVRQLGAFVRGSVPRTRRGRVAAHLETCDRCSTAARELGQVSSNLGALLAPLAGVVALRAVDLGTASGTGAASLGDAVRPDGTGTTAVRPRRPARHTARWVAVAACVAAVAVGAGVVTALERSGSDSSAAPPAGPAGTTDGPGSADAPDAGVAPAVPPAPAPAPPTVPAPAGSPVPAAGPDVARPAADAPTRRPVLRPPPRPRPSPAPEAPETPEGPGVQPTPPATDPALNPRLERSRVAVAPSPSRPGWTRVTVPVTAASPGTVLTATVRGAQEVCRTGAGDDRCSTQRVVEWVDRLSPVDDTVVLDVRHDALAWLGLALTADDRPADRPEDNEVDAILRPVG